MSRAETMKVTTAQLGEAMGLEEEKESGRTKRSATAWLEMLREVRRQWEEAENYRVDTFRKGK